MDFDDSNTNFMDNPKFSPAKTNKFKQDVFQKLGNILEGLNHIDLNPKTNQIDKVRFEELVQQPDYE